MVRSRLPKDVLFTLLINQLIKASKGWVPEESRTSWRTVVSGWRDWTSSSDFCRLGWRDFFVPAVLLSTFIPFFLTSFPLSLIVLFQSCCSHAQVFGWTLVHEFPFSYSQTEWNLLFLKQTALWHEATWDKPEASIKTETEEEEGWVNGPCVSTPYRCYSRWG